MRTVRALTKDDEPRLRQQLASDWGSTRMATRGRLIDVASLPGFVAEEDGQWLGYATYEERDGAIEISVLESLAEGGGVGIGLLAACVRVARDVGASRLWLITTNDNTHALRFYQRRGFVLAALYRDAVAQARQALKREIPELGADGIPIRDEIELELPGDEWQSFIENHAWPQS